MLKRIIAAAFVALSTFAMSPAATAQVSTEAPSGGADRALLIWIQPLMNILDRASVVNDAFVADFNASQRGEALQRALGARDRARNYRVLLTELQAELREMPPFSHPNASPEYVAMTETIVRDTETYLRNLNDVLGHVIVMVDAIEANDEAAIARSRPGLMQSTVLLLDGQIITLRTRQQLIPTDDPAYHSTGAMMVLYQGMRVVLWPSPADRSAALTDASQAAARWGISGRRAVEAMRANLPTVASRERALMDEFIATEGRYYDVNDRVIAALETAAASGGGRDADRQLMGVLVNAEVEYLRLNQRSIELGMELSGAGVEL